MTRDPAASDPYLKIQFNTEVMPTQMRASEFLECSGYYRRTCLHWHSQGDVIPIQSDNREAVIAFIKGCQGDDMRLNDWEKARDVMRLCDRWQVPTLKDKVITLLMSDHGALASFLSDAYDPSNADVAHPIFDFWPHFLQFCQERRFQLLQCLGVRTLHRICSNHRDLICQNMSAVFPFFVHALDEDRNVSLLFDIFEADNFDNDQIRTLIRHRNYCGTNLTRELFRAVLDLRERSKDLDSANQTIARQERTIRHLKGQLTSARTMIHQLNRGIGQSQSSRSPSQRSPAPNPAQLRQIPDGIIAKLTRACGGNVHDKGIVLVTASSEDAGRKPAHIVDLDGDNYFRSRDVAKSWIRWEFKNPVSLVAYAMRSCAGFGMGFSHPSSWELQGSNDGTTWNVLDRRENNDDLNGAGLIAKFRFNQAPSGKFRFIQLVQTGPNHAGNDALVLSAVEMFESA